MAANSGSVETLAWGICGLDTHRTLSAKDLAIRSGIRRRNRNIICPVLRGGVLVLDAFAPDLALRLISFLEILFNFGEKSIFGVVIRTIDRGASGLRGHCNLTYCRLFAGG